MPLLNRIELLRDLSFTELLLAGSQSALAAIAFICVFVAGSSNSLPLMLVRGTRVKPADLFSARSHQASSGNCNGDSKKFKDKQSSMMDVF
ncbi:hypothetical protein DKX38_014541 [Salix brachista]|uniref:Uncharacterized protein n=1 Tax=Salix brachista TaxID=2182728 RepID=A0A5N5LFP1_9ROSI|nr:hypothetical protein DKX38_014541 [Salix brachista]